ncbi:MAG: hypothetical protein WA110_00930 [Anaerolineaceae bacterium]
MEKTEELQQCFCIKADVIGSRLTNKADGLPKVAEKLNENSTESVLTPFTVRAGDELFAVIKNIGDGYQTFKNLFSLSQKYGISLYVGLGVGEVEPQNLKDPERINGAAIWRAANALEELKNKPGSDVLKRISKSDYRYNIHVSDDTSLNQAVETYLYFIMSRIRKRTEQQQLAVEARETNPDWSNDRLFWYITETDENITSSENATANFSKQLMRADYQFIREAENSYIYLLQTLTEKTLQ